MSLDAKSHAFLVSFAIEHISNEKTEKVYVHQDKSVSDLHGYDFYCLPNYS